MYCACGVKKREDGWICECDWEGWYLCFKFNEGNFPKDIPIKLPEKNGVYTVRTFDSGDYDEEESEFSLVKKNWGQATNHAISHWKVEYNDNWMGFKGVYAWNEIQTQN